MTGDGLPSFGGPTSALVTTHEVMGRFSGTPAGSSNRNRCVLWVSGSRCLSLNACQDREGEGRFRVLLNLDSTTPLEYGR